MRLRNLLIIAAITFSASCFSACTDESENIVPLPENYDKATATVGDEPEDPDPLN